MRISRTLLVIILALIVVVLDYQYDWGIVAILGDFFVVLLVLAIVLGAIGIKSGI